MMAPPGRGDPLAVSTHQRELFTGLIRIHVLVHAEHESLFGLAMMEELKHHGYRIGPGTLYPLLHGMERDGLLRSELKKVWTRRSGLTADSPQPGERLSRRPAASSMKGNDRAISEDHRQTVSDLDISEPGESTKGR